MRARHTTALFAGRRVQGIAVAMVLLGLLFVVNRDEAVVSQVSQRRPASAVGHATSADSSSPATTRGPWASSSSQGSDTLTKLTQHESTATPCPHSRRFRAADDAVVERVMLYSFPGSGNTWLRLLLEEAVGTRRICD
jgi:hypothetical protein